MTSLVIMLIVFLFVPLVAGLMGAKSRVVIGIVLALVGLSTVIVVNVYTTMSNSENSEERDWAGIIAAVFAALLFLEASLGVITFKIGRWIRGKTNN